MTYTQDELDRIQELASIFMSISDIAQLLNVSEFQLRSDINAPQTSVHNAYFRGKAMAKEELLRQEMRLAKTGAPQALENTKHALHDMEDDE